MLQFGKVYLATHRAVGKPPAEVAVKILRIKATAADKEDFLAEAEMMLSLKHPNLLAVVGVAIARKPWLLIVDYMKHKDLGAALTQARKAFVPLRVHEMMYFSAQIAEGCAHLEKV